MNNADGWVTIGFKTDSRQLEKDLKDAEKRLKELDDEVKRMEEQKINLKIEVDKDFKKKTHKIYQEYDNERKKMEEEWEMMKGSALAATFQTGRAERRALIEEKYTQKLKEANLEYDRGYDLINVLDRKIQKTKDSQSLVNNNIKEMNSELKSIHGFEKIKSSIDGIGISTQKVVKKVATLSLAVIGIRGAYSAISQAIRSVIAEDENLKYQIDYIKYALGQAIKPIAEFIVNLVYKIATWVGAIVKMLFKVDIFSNATADNFKKANSNANKLRKTLAGFDEMNILNSDGSTGILSSLTLPDLSAQVDEQINKIKYWFTHIPTSEEWKGMIDNMIFPFKTGVEFLKENVWNPFVSQLQLAAETLRPIWEPMWNELQRVVENDIKPKWESLKKFIFEKTEELRPIWEPAKEAFIKNKDEMLRTFAPFINTIIDAINNAFGIFGVHLNRIEIKSEETGEGIEEDIGGALQEVEGDAQRLSDQEFEIDLNATKVSNVNSFLGDIWNKLKDLTSKTWNLAFGGATEFRGGVANAKGGIVYQDLPRLASGGIINQPGRGVPLTSAIGGERGAEGILPLTDSQQMALLGEAIGKYININATVPVYVGNRQIAREMRKIEAEDNFAYNRG